jgi:hypothetical protein
VTTSPAKHPVPTTIWDPTLLLDIDMDQLARPLTLVAHHLAAGAVEFPQPWQLLAPQDRMHRGGRLPEHPTNPVRPHPTAQPAGQDRLFPGWRQPPRAALWS